MCTWPTQWVVNAAGETIDGSSEAWRAECEARYILNMTETKRAEMLNGIESVRKKAGRAKAEAEMQRLWDIKQKKVQAARDEFRKRHERGEN
jgi:hypothetical protein